MLLLQKFQNSALRDTTDTSTSVVHTTAMFALLKVGNYKTVYCLKAFKEKTYTQIFTKIHLLF